MPRCLLLELARSPDAHPCQFDSPPSDRQLGAEPQRRLRDPGPAGDAVAGPEQVSVEREVMRDGFHFEGAEEMNPGLQSSVGWARIG